MPNPIIRTIYVKCLRKKVAVDISTVRRYDSKYYYFQPSDPRSKFTPEGIANILGFGELLETNMAPYNIPVAAVSVAEDLEISTVQAIALLIFNNFNFNEETEEWTEPVAEPFTTRINRQRFVFTTAQSECEAHPFFDSLLTFCQHKDAELRVMPLYYGVQEENALFNEKVFPYLLKDHFVLPKSVVQVLGDLRNTATAINPLSGLKSITQGLTTIVPSTHLMMERVAMPDGVRPLAMWATGCVTYPAYRKTQKTGYKADFHHTFSAVYVEIDSEGNHYIRPLNASSDGSFYDLGTRYQDGAYFTSASKFDMVLGDIHIGSTCPTTLDGFKNLVESVGKPENLIVHDTFDGETINPHEKANPFAKFEHTFSTLQEELIVNAEFLNIFASEYCTNELAVVYSNHNDFLNRWIKSTDWRKLENASTARIYLEAASLACDNKIDDFYELQMEELNVDSNIIFLEEGEDYSPKGIHCGFHGNNGSGGTRGSIKSFAHLGMKTIIGHRHVSGIYKSCIQVGTFTKLKLGYMSGLNACDNSLCIVYENGKRQLVELYQGAWDIESFNARQEMQTKRLEEIVDKHKETWSNLK